AEPLLRSDGSGGGCVGVRPVAELAEVVEPPAQCHAAVRDAAGVLVPCGDVDEIGSRDAHGRHRVGGGAVTELPPVVDAPAEGGAAGGESAGVVVADGETVVPAVAG